MGYKQRVGQSIIAIAYFHTVTENYIDYAYLWDNGNGIDSLSFADYLGDTYMNIGTQTNNGLEFSVFSQLTEKLSVSANISIVDGLLEYNRNAIDSAIASQYHVQVYGNGAFISEGNSTIGLVRRPNTANLSLNYSPFNEFTMRGDLMYVGSRKDVYYESTLGPYGALSTTPVSEYALFDMSASYVFFENLSLLVKIENVFNTNYQEVKGYNTRNRGFFAQLQYTFNTK
jgi:vitamin B12 transporter